MYKDEVMAFMGAQGMHQRTWSPAVYAAMLAGHAPHQTEPFPSGFFRLTTTPCWLESLVTMMNKHLNTD
jgi:hypothetical protein